MATKKTTTKKTTDTKKESPKKTTSIKTSPSMKKERTFTAIEAMKIVGLHRRYELFLNKGYNGEFKTLKKWKECFEENGIMN